MFDRMSTACGPLILSAIVVSSAGTWAQTSPAPNSQPNPYPNVAQWGQLPAGRVWGNTSAIDVDAQGRVSGVTYRKGTEEFFQPASAVLHTTRTYGAPASGRTSATS